MEKIDKPDSLNLFLANVLSSKDHNATDNEYVNCLIDSYAADVINGVMRGKMLIKNHYLLALGLHNMTAT